ncbi:N-acetyl-gamma-glutamyl-phosphate reductase [Tsuneonella mangrovi]|uniref:N-acetyl-gamma-glutamyl-phosphate reductase n=1 Tax=Tsuneonella mangrovi TaxID=1982042 RepID=UPI000BA2B2D8|nr:N-acetyl-gamma-glutamyl-phosphate reductase [Tsuneonella mangrovi]
MSATVFIDGAAGTTGLEIADRLAGRSEFSLVALDDASRKDPAARREALNAADFAILCLPDDAAREAVALVDPDSKVRLIDASSAHRVSDGWTYGFPELVGRDAVAGARFVANPGCYPTGFLALVAPLVRAGLLPADWTYTVNAVSGYSGGGKGLIARFEADPAIGWRGYALGFGHKHLPEMARYAGLPRPPVFTPAVIAAHRGMAVSVPLALSAMEAAPSPAAMRDALSEFYAGSPIIKVCDPPESGEILLRADAAPWDGLELFVLASPDGSEAQLLARLDNLGKGASGAAVQNLNLMAGLDETAGLQLTA